MNRGLKKGGGKGKTMAGKTCRDSIFIESYDHYHHHSTLAIKTGKLWWQQEIGISGNAWDARNLMTPLLPRVEESSQVIFFLQFLFISFSIFSRHFFVTENLFQYFSKLSFFVSIQFDRHWTMVISNVFLIEGVEREVSYFWIKICVSSPSRKRSIHL